MIENIFKSNRQKIVLSFISILLFVYILLFEFILPANKFLPKPLILLESIPSLFQDYNFLTAFLFTFSAIYIIILISYFLINMGKYILIGFSSNNPGLRELFVIGKYVIPLFLIFMFELWFGNSIWGEYLFILAIMMGELKSRVVNEIDTVNEEYLTASKSLGLSDTDIIMKVVWKSIQPKVFDSFITNHINIWVKICLPVE